MFLKLHFLIVLILASFNSLANTIISDLEKSTNKGILLNLSEETILRFSPSKNLILLSNNSGEMGPGDYVTIIKNETPIAQIIIARNKGSASGGKVLKIYSAKEWNSMKEGQTIKPYKGDNSFFFRKKINKSIVKNQKFIEEEDLFSTTNIDFADEIDEKPQERTIKNDNLFGITFGKISSLDNIGQSKRYSHLSGYWAYQVRKNLWAELSYGESKLDGFPAPDINAVLRSAIIRAKYSFAAPFSTFAIPYLGFHFIHITAPSAGKTADEDLTKEEQQKLDREIELVEEAKKRSVIFGVTVLKRLVPGWFLKANFGSDLLSLGIGLEF